MIRQGRVLDWAMDPLEALRRWPAHRRVLLLHSGRCHRRWARWSILAEPVGSYIFRDEHAPDDAVGASAWVGPAACPVDAFTHKPFVDLRRLVSATDGLWIGHLSYDLGRWIERLPQRAADDRAWPVVELGWCPGYLVYDGEQRTWHACGTWRDVYGGPDLWQHDIQGFASLGQAAAPGFSAGDPRSVFTREAYERAVARVLDYIAAGDVFQVNLAQRFTADFDGAFPAGPRALFDRLATISPAWYGAYLELAHESHDARHAQGGAPCRAIASTSPELFLQLDGDRRVTTRPIKGTRPAGVDPAVLRDSQKDTAELNMIVDLMRNDLGRVCDYGSVRVTEARAIETHPTIHHGVATIEGRLHASKDVVDLLGATMPGGSVTGAPKVRVMQIIDELEPVRRGPYCGAIGWISRRQACLSVAIRTMMVQGPGPRVPGQGPSVPGRVDYSVGGGIVADSQPAAEYDETLDKAAAMLRALGAGPSRRPRVALAATPGAAV